MTARQGLEEAMDAAWDSAKKPDNRGLMHDIFDGDMLQSFKDAQGKHLFGESSDGEGQYVFTLCIDFFNPYTMKQVGKKKSIGLISLVCLNLLPDIRYKSENMFLVGIVPGPNEPPLDTHNHYLRPLVDDLEQFWMPGVWSSRTSQFELGHLIRCALVAVVCNLPAAKKTAGFTAFSQEHFCSICHYRQSHEGYGDTQYNSWKWWTNKECHNYAQHHHQAEDAKDAQSCFDEAGIRWSELLRLPYFDPLKFVVVDLMHNLFLGLIKQHFSHILGIRTNIQEEQDIAINIELHYSGTEEHMLYHALSIPMTS